MAVQYVGGGSSGGSLLGALGGLATLGGALFGAPWLTGLGTAMGTADSMINGTYSPEQSIGGGKGGANSLTGALQQMLGLKKSNPASGSIAKSNTEMSSADEAALMRNWRGYDPYFRGNNYGGGLNSWQR